MLSLFLRDMLLIYHIARFNIRPFLSEETDMKRVTHDYCSVQYPKTREQGNMENVS